MADQDFKIYASPDPVAVDRAGVMTQGLGFPLRQVEVEPAPVASIEALRAFSLNTQNPTGLDAPLQLEFGAPQTTTEFDVDAAGNITCLVADEYSIRLRLQMGRAGNPGVAIMFMRALLNGITLGNSVATTLDDSSDVIPTTFTGTLTLAVNDVLTTEIYRDSAGVDEGGVYAQSATLAGWPDSPSTTVVISRVVAGE
jgi:hypothetical protein